MSGGCTIDLGDLKRCFVGLRYGVVMSRGFRWRIHTAYWYMARIQALGGVRRVGWLARDCAGCDAQPNVDQILCVRAEL